MDNTALLMVLGDYRDAENWGQLINLAEMRANGAWVDARREMNKLVLFEKHLTHLPEMVGYAATFAAYNEPHKLIAFGANIAKREEGIIGRALWTHFEESASRAYCYGLVFADAITLFHDMDTRAEIVQSMKLGRQKGKFDDIKVLGGVLNEGTVEVQKLDLLEEFNEKIQGMRAQNLPVPSAKAVIKTMNETWRAEPKFLYNSDYTGWDEYLYETLTGIIDNQRPAFTPSPPKPEGPSAPK